MPTTELPGMVKVVTGPAAAPAGPVAVVTDPAATLGPTTTAEEDRKTQGQRQISQIWEFTQAAIAMAVTVAMIYVAVAGIDSQRLGDAFTLIIALYFVRTNHTKIGGSDTDHR